jgi:hypothetical protein
MGKYVFALIVCPNGVVIAQLSSDDVSVKSIRL